MVSKSKAAQEQLAELEKLSAPFEDQLVEAAKFVGVDLDTLSQAQDNGENTATGRISVAHFGREEWALRWLLKKLLVPRKTASSWILLLHLLRTIPVTNAAKILVERNFVAILKVELEALVAAAAEDTQPVPTKEEKKSSKKRKRSGEVLEVLLAQDSTGLSRILESIFGAVSYVANASNPLADDGLNQDGDVRSAAFAAEYMRKTIRTSSEEASHILGSWLSLCKKALLSFPNRTGIEHWLSPFIRIWTCHTTDTAAYMTFSLNCTQPVLALLRSLKSESCPDVGWSTQLEQLVARNIMNPAKSDRVLNQNSELLSNLTKTSVLLDLANAPLLFAIAIMSIRTHGSRRRKPADDAWLLHVFKTLKEAMPSKGSMDGKVISDLLQLAIKYRVTLDLSILRTITTEFALPDGSVGWQLVTTMIKLDSNVFLIVDKESEDNLLDKLLEEITKASLGRTWLEISKHVVSEVVIPLMSEFAKARDLTGFMHHWYAQLVEFEKQRVQSKSDCITFSAWEDEALQTELRKLFEPSLTVQQIEQILEWLSVEALTSPDAVCVLLDAIAGSLVGEAVIDVVGLKIYDIMFADDTYDRLGDRYRWHSWRLVSRIVDCTTYQNVDRLLILWQEGSKPFDLLPERVQFAEPDEMNAGVPLELLESLRLACSMWCAPTSGNLKDKLVKPVIQNLLLSLKKIISASITDLKEDHKEISKLIESELNCSNRSRQWFTQSLVKCVFNEYPRALLPGVDLEDGDLRELLQKVFWICSASTPDAATSSWLNLNHEVYPSLWLSMLACDEVLDSRKFKELMINIMLDNQSNLENPLLESSTTNIFTVNCLLQLRMETFNKKQRETILKGWLPTQDSETNEKYGLSYEKAVDPMVLSLKIKMMEFAMFYDGMEFDQFIHLATALTVKEDSKKEVSLALLKVLCRKTFEHVHSIPKESRNKAYIQSAFKTIQKKVKKIGEKSKHKVSYSLITIFEVVIRVLVQAKTVVVDEEDLETLALAFKSHLLDQLKSLVHDIRKGKAKNNKEAQLTILSILDALPAAGVTASDLEGLRKDALKYISSDTSELNVGAKLETFLFIIGRSASADVAVDDNLADQLVGDVKTSCGRQSIIQKIKTLSSGDDEQKLKLLKSIFGPNLNGIEFSDKLLAARQVIVSIDSAYKSEDESASDLSEAYSILCGHLWKTRSIVQFCIISETLQLMLQTKARSISQFNVDTTLCSVAVLCSRHCPLLPTSRAETVYTHLCHLLRNIILHHRLKLQGHMHLIVQSTQVLLRCLFRPLPSTHTPAHLTPPPWLPPTSPSLSPKAAESFTRLLTLLCDPSESSLHRHNQSHEAQALTSAKSSWKKITGWHMQFLLMEFLARTLDMRLEREVREKLVPGLWAILDTMGIGERRALGERLDSSQRAVWSGLVRDWGRFGRWEGN